MILSYHMYSIGVTDTAMENMSFKVSGEYFRIG